MTITEIAAFLGGRIAGDGDVEILRVAGFENASGGEITFLEKTSAEGATAASCIIVPENSNFESRVALIHVSNPKLSFARIAAILHPPKRRAVSARVGTEIASTAFVAQDSAIGDNCVIGENVQILDGVKIGDDVRIGDGSIIHPNCVIYDCVTIGRDCVIHAGAIIGADGFGFVKDGARGYVKFPQIGTVNIGDDVEIGAGTCVDRGALGETVIGNGTKIDNLVQVAHNVRIGERVVIASQTGISGSTVIEDDCVIGGQVGFGDHAHVQSGAVIGSQAGILPNKIVRPGVWWGTPIQPLEDFKRQNAHLKGIERLKNEVRELRKIVDELRKAN